MAGFEKDLIRKTSGLNAALLALAFSLAGCSSLASAVLKPQVESAPVSVPAGDYALDTKHASILFKISHLGYSSYVGRFNTFDASLTGDPAHPEAATVTAVVDMTSLDIANPEFAGELMGPDWFDA
ncbi:MAG: YceI family protein, partial [Alphaproteobacteria bacterium]|nr:YceI family protein [Alphaproteobacteria bacterium]